MVTLREQKICLKCLQPLEHLVYFGNGFRPFHRGNMGSADQRAAKLLAVKVGVLKKKSAALAIPANACAIAFGPGSNPGAVESFSKFDSRQL